MIARASISSPQLVLIYPMSRPTARVAPGKGPYTGYVFVFDPATSKVRRTPIRARGATDNMVAISQGIKPGDVIAVAGVSFLTDGQKVKLYTP